MCLAVPGKIIELKENPTGAPIGSVGTVDFQGSQIEVGLAFVPEAKVGDYVLLHTGYAINVIDPVEAEETLKLLRELSEIY